MSVHLLNVYFVFLMVLNWTPQVKWLIEVKISPSGMGQSLPAIPITCRVNLWYLSSCLNSVVLSSTFQYFQILVIALLKLSLSKSPI